MTLQEICDKHAFAIYEWGRIRGKSKKLAIRKFWIDVNTKSTCYNEFKSGWVIYTPFNKITYIESAEEGEMLTGYGDTNGKQEWHKEFEIEEL